MKIELMNVTVGEVYEGYFNDAENEMGVTGYNDQLNIRPKYQRNYIYKDQKRDEVIRTILKGYPLNVFYWVDLGEQADELDPRYEVLDGQQRTISFCDYIDGVYSVDGMYFHSLPKDKQEAILSYKLFVYVCNGTESEKLEWFRIINIAGVPLTDQELRNAVYSGTWVSDAKRYFSKSNGPAYQLAGDYMSGEANRQEYMATAIKWHAALTGETIEAYMSRHQHDPKADELWRYFRDVFDWVQKVFPKVRAQMKGLPWGLLFNEHGGRTDLSADTLERQIADLLADYDVTSKRGVYEYVLTGDERKLSIRAFEPRVVTATYEAQRGICPICGKHFALAEMHADHIVPWSKGGHTVPENCQMLCRDCNLRKGAQ